MAKTVSVQFIRNCSPYNEGDKAGFDQAVADKYVKRGIANYVTTAVAQAPVVKFQKPEIIVEPSPSAPAAKVEVDSVKAEPPKPAAKKKKKKKTRTRKRAE